MRRVMLLCGGLAVAAAAAWIGESVSAPRAEVHAAQAAPAATPEMLAKIAEGSSQFQQKCSFCHGRDAGGGETGPDLTRSKLVLEDVNGNKIGEVVRTGRAGKMPPFDLSSAEMDAIAAFIHAQQAKAKAEGGRRGVNVEDLQTGNVAEGKAYFEGAGTCAKCHSATGDLAHIATKYQGLQLEQHMLYPRDAKSRATVTLPSGQVVSGTVQLHDEFFLGIVLADGTYRSWPVDKIKYTIDAPHEAHAKLFPHYTDADIHNLMAYLQTLR